MIGMPPKWSAKPFDRKEIGRLARDVAKKPLPLLESSDARRDVIRALFVPAAPKGLRSAEGVQIVTAAELLS